MDSIITRITNPNSKKIKVGLPYTNLNLIGNSWWYHLKYAGSNMKENVMGVLSMGMGDGSCQMENILKGTFIVTRQLEKEYTIAIINLQFKDSGKIIY